MQQRDKRRRDGLFLRLLASTVLSLGNRFREMPMDGCWIMDIPRPFIEGFRTYLKSYVCLWCMQYHENWVTFNTPKIKAKSEPSMNRTRSDDSDHGWMDANTFYTTSSRSRTFIRSHRSLAT